MLTRLKARLTAEEFQELKIDVGVRKTFSKVEMSETKENEGTPSISEKAFFEAFMTMKSMVEELYSERRERSKGASSVKAEEGEGAGGGGGLRALPILLILFSFLVILLMIIKRKILVL